MRLGKESPGGEDFAAILAWAGAASGDHGSRLLPPPPQHHCGPWVQEWIVFQ